MFALGHVARSPETLVAGASGVRPPPIVCLKQLVAAPLSDEVMQTSWIKLCGNTARFSSLPFDGRDLQYLIVLYI